MHFSIRLRKILLSNWLYVSCLFLAGLFVFYAYLHQEKIPTFKENKTYDGTISTKKVSDDSILIETKGKEAFSLFLSKKDLDKEELKKLVVGSKIAFQGTAKRIEDTVHNFYGSSYQNYLARKHIFYEITPSKIEFLPQEDWIENIRKNLYCYLETFPKTSAYLKTFLLGDSSDIAKTFQEAYQEIGISHLFALSGMHISFLIGGIYTILKKKMKREKFCFFGICVVLCFYLLLVKRSPSILRASLFFVFFEGNKCFDFYIKPYQILLGILSLLLFINPYLFEDLGFLYSFSIASTLVLFQKHFIKGGFFKNVLGVSIFSFFVSLPITMKTQYQINFASLLFNFLLVPFVSMVVFPLSFLVVVFPFLEPLFSSCLFLLETISSLGSTLSLFKVCFLKISEIYYIFLFLLFLVAVLKKPLFIIYGLCLLLHAFLLPMLKEDRITMLDVGQGDCFLFESKGKALLLDVGGKEGVSNQKQKASFLIKELRARGISSLQIILSHGDQDHAGNTMYLLKNIKVTSVYTNLGSLTSTEKEIQKEANMRKIPFQKEKEGATISLGNFFFQQLNPCFSNENDSSSVYYVTHGNYKMLFLGDASSKTEERLLKTYQIKNLTLLKLGHHGSKTSTSDALLQNRKIAMALISSGRNNKFHHPSPLVLKRLDQYKIPYLNTQEKGSVEITFPNLLVKTALP